MLDFQILFNVLFIGLGGIRGVRDIVLCVS